MGIMALQVTALVFSVTSNLITIPIITTPLPLITKNAVWLRYYFSTNKQQVEAVLSLPHQARL